MATLSRDAWVEYAKAMGAIDSRAKRLIENWITSNGAGIDDLLAIRDKKGRSLIDYAHQVAVQYGQASSAMAADMYDMLALFQNVDALPAEMAEQITYGEVAKAVKGTLKTSHNTEEIAGAVSRLVKMAGADTMLQNAYREYTRPGRRHTRAEWAWIPVGDTCAYCLMLASNGWQPQTVWARGHHAQHIHANCDCTYAVRFRPDFEVGGYSPEQYYAMLEDADPEGTWEQRVNAVRRQNYARNKEEINEQKRSAYAKMRAREAPSAEETYVN